MSRVQPAWPPEGSGLRVETRGGTARLTWRAATDADGMYGYQILRAAGDGPLVHHASVRAAISTEVMAKK